MSRRWKLNFRLNRDEFEGVIYDETKAAGA